MPSHRTDLQTIPGVGPSIEQDLLDLGFESVDQLCDQDPEELYERLCELRGERLDRCLLYVFRTAVYFAGTDSPEPALLEWWNWKGASAIRPT